MSTTARVVMVITNTGTLRKNDPITPKCKKSSGPRTLNSSVTGLWNGTETYLRDVLSQCHFSLQVSLKNL